MKLKMTHDGHAVIRNGMPVYLHTDGSEEAFDAPAAMKLARGQAFAGSKYIAEQLSIHPELAAAAFGDAFRLEKGQLVAYGAGGVPLYSHRRPGELASLDEALEQMVAKYPSKDMILRKDGAPAAPGAGAAVPVAQPGPGAVISRQQFDALNPQERMNHIKAGGTVADGASKPAPATPAQGAKVLTRVQFEQLPHIDRAAYCKSGGTIEG